MAPINVQTTKNVNPQCYAYTTPEIKRHDGWVKIGYTERDVEERIKEQLHTSGVGHITHWAMRAAYLTEPYNTFRDDDFHAYLKKLGIEREPNTEWFKIDPLGAKSKYMDFAENHGIIGKEDTDPVIPYKLREEQEQAVEMAEKYFKSHAKGEFLWNAKPRFGKTLAAYELCKRLNAKNILIVTNRPAIANSWYKDYERFLGRESGYYFVSRTDAIKGEKLVESRQQYQELIASRGDDLAGCIEFVSLQDLKGSIYAGGKYDKLLEISSDEEYGIKWDVLIIDEAHEGIDTYKTDTAFNQIRRKHTLHLSGTPFKALANDKFSAEAIYNWTYADEQKKKREWDNSNDRENPYEPLPRLSLYTYKMSDIVLEKVKEGIEISDEDKSAYAFDLNEFFETDSTGKFKHDSDVDKFLDALVKQEKFPFSTTELRDELKHTFWLLKYVDSAKALAKKLHAHPVFKDYEIILAAGDGKLDDDDENIKSYDKVTEAVKNYDKTITLSVGQLTTGVTIPEWTAVLMLSNMRSPSLYMQAAFRAQNPWSYEENGEFRRKTNAYVFDFDPARTLSIYEKFANDLIPDISGDMGEDSRKKNIRELLNFFPVYGEDEDGSMVELDAEKVLSIPRRIHAKEVVARGFMSNFLFANIGGIFAAPKEILDIIDNMEPIEENGLKPAGIDDKTAEKLNLNEAGEVEISDWIISAQTENNFGEPIYAEIEDRLVENADTLIKASEENPSREKEELDKLQNMFSEPIADTLIGKAKSVYGKDLNKSETASLERKIRENTDKIITTEYGNYSVRYNVLEKRREDKIEEAQKAGAPMQEITKIKNEFEQKQIDAHREMIKTIKDQLDGEQIIEKSAKIIVEAVEKHKSNVQKESIEENVRKHLNGFARTIPAFLMAYGDENTTLAEFDKLVPEDVFWEVTSNPKTGIGITLDQFRMLRDGGDYETEDGEIKHFDGHLFDEVVFNDAVKEFMKKRKELANYFDPNHKEDIFDYIPPQRTNQIFTPKKIVKDMADKLEEENPGCFNDPEATFADLYMKSGMYITEIVKRLFSSEKLKELFPNDKQRLNHIFANQVYGCAPTEIIHRISRNYILGFSDDIKIEKDNIVLCDTLKYAKDGALEQKLEEAFGQ